MSLLPSEVLFSRLLTALCLRDKASVHNTYDQWNELFTVCGVDDLSRNRNRMEEQQMDIQVRGENM